jgi:hypothetical protein
MTLPSNPTERLKLVEKMRHFSSDTLLKTFLTASDHVSELEFSQAWLKRLREDESLFPEGWYQPPPSGAVVLFGQPPMFERLQFSSLRAQEYWPKSTYYLNDGSLVYAYYSPVDRESGLIGDMAITLYRGSAPAVREHVIAALQITADVVEYAEVGMPLAALYAFGTERIRKAGLINRTVSITDPHGIDIGHTIPWSYDTQTDQEEDVLKGSDKSKIWKMISSKRRFLDSTNDLIIAPNMAFTVEPKVASKSLPTVSFHIIVKFLNGEKRVISGYRSLFNHFGMMNYLPEKALKVLECPPTVSEPS